MSSLAQHHRHRSLSTFDEVQKLLHNFIINTFDEQWDASSFEINLTF